jgi:hypothetical protein
MTDKFQEESGAEYPKHGIVVESLVDLLKIAVEVIEFGDGSDCDFGPAYGLAMKRRQQFMRLARQAITKYS